MEWWQQLILSLVTILVGAFLGYFLSRFGAKQEKESRTGEKLEEAISGILVELETNLKLAKKPFQNRLVPFVTSMWEVHKGEILRLPKKLKDVLYQVYVEIEMANNLVEADIHQLEYGRGYYNEPYKEKKNSIVGKTEQAIKGLEDWLETGENKEAIS
ncbi:hypothetical protein ES703_51111 [subsurface metagenome]